MARSVTKFDPFMGLDALRRGLFSDLAPSPRATLPTTDVYTEGDKELVVDAYLPNFEEKDINVTVDHGALVIQAERREKEEDKDKKYVVRESSTSFYRSILLPEHAQNEEITANFDKGVLKVRIPLSADAAPRSISIGKGKS